MTRFEKLLYHQIHPAKLLTDWGTALVALPLVWQGRFALGLVVAFVPSVIASALLVRYFDLSRLQRGALGRYVARYMNGAAQAVRFAGFALAVLGAWLHEVWPMPLGLAVILAGWLYGLVWERLNRAPRQNPGLDSRRLRHQRIKGESR